MILYHHEWLGWAGEVSCSPATQRLTRQEPPKRRQQPGTPQPALTNGGDFSCHPHTAFPGLVPLGTGEDEEANEPMLGATVVLALRRGRGLHTEETAQGW